MPCFVWFWFWGRGIGIYSFVSCLFIAFACVWNVNILWLLTRGFLLFSPNGHLSLNLCLWSNCRFKYSLFSACLLFTTWIIWGCVWQTPGSSWWGWRAAGRVGWGAGPQDSLGYKHQNISVSTEPWALSLPWASSSPFLGLPSATLASLSVKRISRIAQGPGGGQGGQ